MTVKNVSFLQEVLGDDNTTVTVFGYPINKQTFEIIDRVNNLSSIIEKQGGEGSRNATIYTLWKLGSTQQELADRFSLSVGRVGAICQTVSKYAKKGSK